MKYKIENPDGSGFCVGTFKSESEARRLAIACAGMCTYVKLYRKITDGNVFNPENWRLIGKVYSK